MHFQGHSSEKAALPSDYTGHTSDLLMKHCCLSPLTSGSSLSLGVQTSVRCHLFPEETD